MSVNHPGYGFMLQQDPPDEQDEASAASCANCLNLQVTGNGWQCAKGLIDFPQHLEDLDFEGTHFAQSCEEYSFFDWEAEQLNIECELGPELPELDDIPI